MNNRKPALIVAIWLLWSAFLMYSRPGEKVIVQWGNTALMNNSITVQWEWKTDIKPDIFVFTISANEKWATTKEVNELLATKLSQAKEILKKNGVADKDITSTNISVYPNWEYTNNTSVQKWFLGNHGLTIKVRNIENAWPIIDSVSAINGLLVQWWSYDVDDKEKALESARKDAFENAQAKAEQLANLAGVKLWKPMSITDMTQNYPQPIPMYAGWREMAMDQKAVAPSTEINPGETTYTMQVNVMFAIE